MDTKTKFLTAAGVIALGLATTTTAHDAKAKEGFEKCYGVVKAGKNDCGASDGSHGCAGHAEADNLPAEWLFVPEGTCDKLAGGSTEGAK